MRLLVEAMRYDWVVAGAGLVGCTVAERIATQLDQKVLVVEKRNHIGGSVYDEADAHGILVHRYGPHLFHTNDQRVWEYLSGFTQWRPYEHRVLARVNGKLIPVPFNFNSLHALFPSVEARKLESLLLAEFGPAREIPILRLRECRESEIRRFADFVYEKIFYGYTLKQWDLIPEQLGPTVLGRVPVRLSRDDRYFRGRHQAIPANGYTSMVRRMLSHRNIDISLRTDFRDLKMLAQSRLVYTGPIDEFFDFMHGPLPYRSLRFEFSHQNVEFVQPVAQINYPNEHAYTRSVEHKHFTGQKAAGTTISKEFPQPHRLGENEPYYPIPCQENLGLFAKYAKDADELGRNVLFAGRLADYKYYNMDQAVARALWLFTRRIVHDDPADSVLTTSGC